MFKQVNPKQSFPVLEKEIINFWKENNTFKKSIETRENSEEFNFYDGPPFATGTPHYGHILAGTIKDVIPRYQTMLGRKVERKFGWDCHGLPIEGIVEKKLGIKSKKQIDDEIGVFKFNEECRANVLTYVDDWEKSVERMGRWVDMKNDYKTMDASFMESVWWVFSELYKKGLIYQDYRVVPYSVGMATPLSNFEVNQNYQDKQDKTITVKFKVVGSSDKYILAWTTTPWTLVSNLGLAVGENVIYVELLDKSNNETYILAKSRVGAYYKDENDYTIVREYPGTCLVGYKYEPLYTDFVTLNESNELPIGQKFSKNTYSVVLGHHVTDENGTGVVHIAPAYGEDDMVIGREKDLGFVAHIDDNGYTTNLLENNGVWVFDFNELAIETMKKAGLSVKIDTIMHSYPFCWRTDIPLIYRAISAWYVDVESIKDKMLNANENINWVPENLKYGRFGKWLEGARDWNISRNRYWGSAIPVWQSDDKKHELCVGSIEELYELNKVFGQIEKKEGKYFYTNSKKEIDLHKHFVDNVFLENKNNFVTKNALGIHCYGGNVEYGDFWKKTKENLSNNGVNLITPQFSEDLVTKYSDWESVLKTYDFSNIDTLVGHSLGTRVALEFVVENNIKLERLFLISPTITGKNADGLERKGIENFFGNNDFSKLNSNFEKLNQLVKEIIVISSKDDKLVPFEESKQLAKILNANFIEVDGFGHFNLVESKLLEGIIKHGSPLKRIPEVLDCWFESGSMPYASKHYPFENSDCFKFPADFIAEGIDQTRGWFYTLVVLSAALFDKNPFNNVVVNGIVLAEDGKKMSKRLQNYPDPTYLMDTYGADAMRFYLMNSPVVEAQDLRFSEAGVEEVVKKVILPLWNTYSFFTTYANIDKFQPKKGNIFYVRHGETKNNAEGRMNAGESDSLLNETGIKQAIKAGQNFKITGVKLEKIYVSPRERTRETAKLIVNELGYDVEIIEDERLIEQYAGKFDGMTHDEIKKMYNVSTNTEMRKLYKEENGVENIEVFEKRVLEAFNQIQKENETKNVLIVAHAGTFRPINRYLNDLTKEEAHFSGDSLNNGIIYKLPNYIKNNPLDKWIISELNTLVGDISASLDSYKLNEAAKPIVKFMDNLTNWYIRRSRKRFWKSDTDLDKVQAYNTLYDVLVETSKVIAPYMPFVSEYIFKNLTGNESVHLELYPTKNKSFIFEDLNKNTSEVQNIITLGLAVRANAKIRVRQPLNYVKISHKLSEYFEEIIKEELNVKEIKVFEDDEIPSQICKPNARLIGPKFGQNVKFIISEAKSGNFKLLENGNVLIPHPNPLLTGEGKEEGFILLPGEFEIEFVSNQSSKNENEILESGNGLVVALDKTITETLKLEGYCRDIVRHIQESRKEANFNVDDRIEVSITGDGVSEILQKFGSYIESETLSTLNQNLSNPNFEKEVEVEDLKIKLSLKK